ncbi:MAG: hypothetical protein ACI4IE_05010, partial [Eubacterium sp.]
MINFSETEYNNPNKHYTNVKALFDTEGNIIPLSITYDDREFEIDRVTDVRPAASLKSGGAGIRYTCYIDGKKSYLFLEENRWFAELCQ